MESQTIDRENSFDVKAHSMALRNSHPTRMKCGGQLNRWTRTSCITREDTVAFDANLC